LIGGALVGPFVDLDVEVPAAPGLGSAHERAMKSREGDDGSTPGKTGRLHDFGDGSNLRVGAFVPRDQNHAGLVRGVQRDGDGHVRKDNGVVQRDE